MRCDAPFEARQAREGPPVEQGPLHGETRHNKRRVSPGEAPRGAAVAVRRVIGAQPRDQLELGAQDEGGVRHAGGAPSRTTRPSAARLAHPCAECAARVAAHAARRTALGRARSAVQRTVRQKKSERGASSELLPSVCVCVCHGAHVTGCSASCAPLRSAAGRTPRARGAPRRRTRARRACWKTSTQTRTPAAPRPRMPASTAAPPR